MGRVLAEADPGAKAELYANLGIEITYSPDQRVVSVAARPFAGVQQSVSEGGLQPSSLGSSPVHLIVYKVEPPVCAVPTT